MLVSKDSPTNRPLPKNLAWPTTPISYLRPPSFHHLVPPNRHLPQASTDGDALELILTLTTTTMRAPVYAAYHPYGTRRAAAAGRWLETPNFIKNFSEAMQINSRNSAATCTDAQAAAFIATFNTPYELYVVANLGYMQLDYLLDCSALDCKYTTSHDTFALHTNQHGLKTVIHHSGDWNKAFERYTNMHKLILHDDGGMITYDELASYSKWFNDIVNSSTIDHRVTFEACYLADQEWRCRAAFEPDLKLTDQAERGPLFLQYVGPLSLLCQVSQDRFSLADSQACSQALGPPNQPHLQLADPGTHGVLETHDITASTSTWITAPTHTALDPMSVLSVWPLAFRLFTPAPVSATPTTSNVFVLYSPGTTRLHLPAPPSAKPQPPYQSTHNQRPHPLGLPLQTPLLLPPLCHPGLSCPFAEAGVEAATISSPHGPGPPQDQSSRDTGAPLHPRWSRGMLFDPQVLPTGGAASDTETAAPLPSPPVDNQQYKVLEAALRKAIPWKIVHTICLGKLARYLRRHPNKPFTQSLLSGIKIGVWYGDGFTSRPEEPRLLRTAPEDGIHGENFEKYVLTEVQAGRSVNDHIPDSHAHVRYDPLIEFIPILIWMHQHTARDYTLVLWKLDCSAAFRQVPVHPVNQAMQSNTYSTTLGCHMQRRLGVPASKFLGFISTHVLSGCSSSYRRRRLEVSYDYTLGDQRMQLLNTSRMRAKMASVSGIRLYDSGSTTAPLRRITTTTHLYTLAANCLGTQTIKESQSTSTPTVPVDISTTSSSSP
ncbi:hypothetical protein DFJ73DRAFT_782263 [Zopfochytrium polystomum]|nr:hypothetical protein DFJ73DRAFT_782263 [Zopfochytrium polystomum]